MSISIIATIKKKEKHSTMATIYIRGYYNRRPVAAISTGKKIAIEHWDPELREVKKQAPNASLINTVIQTKLQAMQTQLLQKEIMGSTINTRQVIMAVKGKNDSADFLKFCREQIEEYDSSETRRTYKSEVSKLEQFRAVISFSDIEYTFLAKYKKYMQNGLKNSPNTIWKTFKFLKTMCNRAIECGGIIRENPLNKFDCGSYENPLRDALDIEDCDAIEKLCDHQNEMIRKVAIYFLLMAYSGMRFKDAMEFDPDVHVVDDSIKMTYQKADTIVNNKIHDRLANIIQLVKRNKLNIGNREFNETLKIIAVICNININLTAHLGRHTMGGLLADLEIPIEQAKEILGHKDMRSTQVYYHVKAKTIGRAMDKFNSLPASKIFIQKSVEQAP